MTDDMGALDLERVHQPDCIGRHAIDGETAAGGIALPDPAMIVGNDVELAAESRGLILPIGGKPAQPRDEHHGEADPLPLVIQLAVADQDPRHRYAMQSGECVGITARVACQTGSRRPGLWAVSAAANCASNLTHGPRRMP